MILLEEHFRWLFHLFIYFHIYIFYFTAISFRPVQFVQCATLIMWEYSTKMSYHVCVFLSNWAFSWIIIIKKKINKKLIKQREPSSCDFCQQSRIKTIYLSNGFSKHLLLFKYGECMWQIGNGRSKPNKLHRVKGNCIHVNTAI